MLKTTAIKTGQQFSCGSILEVPQTPPYALFETVG